MRVTVEGIVMEVQRGEKDGKEHYTAYLYQPGERELIRVRLTGGADAYCEGEKVSMTGRLVAWKTKDSVDYMVMQE